MNKLKTIHIHTDYKFVNISVIFDGELFENESIVFQNKVPFTGNIPHPTKSLGHNIRGLIQTLKICRNADLVVLYDLNLIKCLIAIFLSNKVKIAWRFFGYELYAQKESLVMSKKTIAYKSRGKHLLNSLVDFIKPKIILNYIFNKAIKRINYMLVLSSEEYVFLKNNWGALPAFIKIPHSYFDDSLLLPQKKQVSSSKPVIIIGNNRSSYNNHLDIIDIIDSNPNRHNFHFTLLFNYGPKGAYYDQVKKQIFDKPYYSLIEDFLSQKKFNKLYENIDALVINSYRQMAGANIFSALKNGVKVYLSDKNIFKEWMLNEGIAVFSTVNFDTDLKNNDIKLSVEMAKKNLEQLKKFSKRYTKENFMEIMYHKITNNRP